MRSRADARRLSSSRFGCSKGDNLSYQLGSSCDGGKLVVAQGRERQNLTGTEVISRKSGTSPVRPNWAVVLSSVCRQRMVLKPISMLAQYAVGVGAPANSPD